MGECPSTAGTKPGLFLRAFSSAKSRKTPSVSLVRGQGFGITCNLCNVISGPFKECSATGGFEDESIVMRAALVLSGVGLLRRYLSI